MEGSDVCFAPILSMSEAPEHPHNKLRKTFVEIDGVLQPAPSPRFNRTECEITNNSRTPGQDSDEILSELGLSESEISELKSSGAVS